MSVRPHPLKTHSTKDLEGIALPPARLHGHIPRSWFRDIRGAGYVAVAIQINPFPPKNTDPDDNRAVMFRLCYLYDLARSAQFQTYVRRVARAAHGCGLKFYLDCWEPSVPMAVWKMLPANWRATINGQSQPHNLCFRNQAAAEWYWRLVCEGIETVPDLDGFILGREDNVTRLCDATCPVCVARPPAERWAEFYATFRRVATEARPKFELVLYDWWWQNGDHQAILSRLSRGTALITRFETNLKPLDHPAFVSTEQLSNDVNLSVAEPTEDAQDLIQVARKRAAKLYAMIPFLGPIECFFQPYALAPRLYARKLDGLRRERFAGWMDYDCGGADYGMTLDLLREVKAHPQAGTDVWVERMLTKRYGLRLSTVMAEVTRHFERVIELFPVDLFTRDCRLLHAAGYVLGLCIGTPLRPADAWAACTDREWPASRPGHDPHNYFAPRSHARLLQRLPLLLEHQNAGMKLLNMVKTGNKNFLRDRSIAAAYTCVLRSAWHFMAMGDQVQWVRKERQIIPARLAELAVLVELEVENVKAFARLAREDSALFTNSTWNSYLCLKRNDARLPDGPAVWDAKIRLLQAIHWEEKLTDLLKQN
ncbi:MAG TPA: hypothetical protein VN784_14820 [Candidatus Limnocylindrales bacterium]|nr:hypothetical protein [Candidatus Limnocylindrales bacterium]